jgi:hypothetical protein
MEEQEQKKIIDILERQKKIKELIVEQNKVLATLTSNEEKCLNQFYFGDEVNQFWNYRYGMPSISIPLNFVKMPVNVTDIDGFHWHEQSGRMIFFESKFRLKEIPNDKQIKALKFLVSQFKSDAKWTLIVSKHKNAQFDNMEPKVLHLSEQEVAYCIDETGERNEFKSKTVKDTIKEILEE